MVLVKIAVLIILLVVVLAATLLVKLDEPVEALRQKYATEASRFVEIEGLNVHYRDEGSGPALLMLHGSGASLLTWDGWVDALKDSLRLIRLDLPGFGLTGPNATHDYTMPAYTHFLSQFLDEIGVDRCSVAGNSLGGRIAWELALAEPDRVEKLILIDAEGFPYANIPLGFKLSRNAVGRLLVRFLGVRALVESSLKEVYFDDSKITPDIVTQYYDMSLRAGNRAAYIARANMVFENTLDKLSAIYQPALILWGEKDAWDPLENAYHYRQALPDARVISYSNAGHIPMEEIPRQTADDAGRFVLHGTPQQDANVNGK